MQIMLILILNYLSAIYNFDTSVVNLEALQQIYEVVSIAVILVRFKFLKQFNKILNSTKEGCL
jgi:hypothetical protein